MKTIRFGVVGVGLMGSFHAGNFGKIRDAELVAVCDIDRDRADKCAAGCGVKAYYSADDLLNDRTVDAVVVATPHYDHTSIGIKALEMGYHLLVEKPISAHKADCERLIAAHTDKTKVFGAMFQMQADPHFRKLKKIIDEGELGTLTRINWIITDWFRTQSYYDNGGWRATWKGEGGGVLLNQCPHNLDMIQWLCGMPLRLRAFCHMAKRHHIEVEDEVTAYLEYENGATGVFVTSTGEAPGTNRLEICGEKGRIVLEDDKLHFKRNEIAASVFCAESKSAFGKPEVWEIEIPVRGRGGLHMEILQNFVDTINGKKPLIAPAEEGIRSVELANAMLYSSLTGETIDLPLDSGLYEQTLQQLIRESTFEKRDGTDVEANIESSF
ncbi:MAG: Gfo/Idh/MocA family oxidoreductase [Proteobacteria bacterium]|nr:Gfo/Idh/MocA family oxidoreductase [Pseudomonadota bacterium]